MNVVALDRPACVCHMSRNYLPVRAFCNSVLHIGNVGGSALVVHKPGRQDESSAMRGSLSTQETIARDTREHHERTVCVAANGGGSMSFRSILTACALVAVTIVCVAANAADATYTVKPCDILKSQVWKEPELQGEVLITPDGSFAFPLVGQIDARNKTVSELQKTIAEKLAKYISDPVVSVSVREIKGNKVYVIGQVAHPGEFIVNPRVDVMQALSMAGGTT